MSTDDYTPSELVSRFAEPPYRTWLIEPPDVSIPIVSGVDRDTCPFSIGVLRRLPLEVIHEVLVNLDLPSLAQFSCVCARAHAIVASVRQVTTLKICAKEVLATLSRTGLLGTHTILKLHSTLRCVGCHHCGEVGPFVFLPTFERCCFLCLRMNPALWTGAVGEVREVFHLSSDKLSRLPVCRTIPDNIRRREERVVSLKQAKELADEDYGPINMDGILASVTGVPDHRLLEKAEGRYRIFRTSPLHRDCFDQAARAANDIDVDLDIFQGRAAMCLPFFTPARQLERGLWCRGCCKRDYTRHTCYLLNDDNGVSKFFLPDMDGCRLWTEGPSLRAWTKEGFLEHVKDCQGVQDILTNGESDDDDDYEDDE